MSFEVIFASSCKFKGIRFKGFVRNLYHDYPIIVSIKYELTSSEITLCYHDVI